jgi:hypothetical protein
MPDELKVRVVHQVGDVLLATGEQVVRADDFMVLFQQTFAEMGAEEASAAGDENAFFHGCVEVLRKWDARVIQETRSLLMPSAADFFGSLIFGAIGMGALLYGKSVGSVVKMGLGAALLGCSYLITESWLLWTSGAVLTLLLMRWKE